MAAALVQNGHMLTRYDKFRLNSEMYRIPAPRQSLKKYVRSGTYYSAESLVERKAKDKYIQESTENNNRQQRRSHTIGNYSAYNKCNTQPKNQYQKVQEAVRTRKSSCYKSLERIPAENRRNPRKHQYQVTQVEQHSREKEATLQVPESYCAPNLNDGDYLLAKRKPSRHQSLKQIPAKSDESHVTNSADYNNTNNNTNYYEALGSEDDEDIEYNTVKTGEVDKTSIGSSNGQVSLRSVASYNTEDVTEVRDAATTLRGECVLSNCCSGKTAKSDSQRATVVTKDNFESIGRTKSGSSERAGVLVPTTEQRTDIGEEESSYLKNIAQTSTLSDSASSVTLTIPETVHNVCITVKPTNETTTAKEKAKETVLDSEREKRSVLYLQKLRTVSIGRSTHTTISELSNSASKSAENPKAGVPAARKVQLQTYHRKYAPCIQSKPDHVPINSKVLDRLNSRQSLLEERCSFADKDTKWQTSIKNNLASSAWISIAANNRQDKSPVQKLIHKFEGMKPGNQSSEVNAILPPSGQNEKEKENIAIRTQLSRGFPTHSENRISCEQQLVIDPQEGTSTKLNAPPYTAALSTGSNEKTCAASRNRDRDLKQSSPQGKPYNGTLGTSPTNHTHKQQQVSTKNNATLPPRSEDTHSRGSAPESIQNGRIFPRQQEHINENATYKRITLKTFNQSQTPSIMNLAKLTNKKGTKLSNQQRQNKAISDNNDDTFTNLSEIKTANNDINNQKLKELTPGHHNSKLPTTRIAVTQTKNQVSGQAIVTTRYNETIKTRTKVIAYNHNDLVTAQANSFPGTYINGGNVTVGKESVTSYKHLIPISIRIQGPRDKQSTIYDPVRVAYSILLALQYADSTARLVVWDYDGRENFKELPQVRICSDFTKDNILDFMEDPCVNRKNMFSGRMCILADCTLNKFKQNEEVRRWLNTEGVYLTKNNLSTVTTSPVGFITGWSPSNITTVHECILANVSKNVPEFLVEDKWISDGENVKIKVIMIRCSKNDGVSLTEALKQRDPTCGFKFYHWEYFSSLSMQEKRHLIQKENAYTSNNRSMQEGCHIPWQSFDLSEYNDQKHDKKRPNRTTITGTYSKVTENRQTCDDDELSSLDATSKQQHSKLCKIDEYQSLMSSNNSINLELKELREKNHKLTATVTRLEKLIQCNMTTTQSILKENVGIMAMIDLQGSANDQAIKELYSNTIPTMRQEFAEEMDNLHDNIDKGFSSVRTTFEQCSKGKAAPTVESQTTTTVQATTYSANSLYCIHAENKMIDITNQRQKIDYNKNKITEPQEVLSTSALMNLKDDKSIDNSSRQHKARHSFLTRGDSKRDVTGGRT
jgi:hypothetical protein